MGALQGRTALDGRDEVVRFGTPVQMFQRTAVFDTEIGGQAISRGQRVGLLYGSANYDEAVFDRPHRFDILCSPNPHVGFGGGGVISARAHISRGWKSTSCSTRSPITFRRSPRVGPPRRLRSGWLDGIKEMPVTYG